MSLNAPAGARNHGIGGLLLKSNRLLELVSIKHLDNNNHGFNYQTVLGISTLKIVKQVNFPKTV